MDQLLTAIATQVPDLGALILIILIFVRYMEKRDELLKALTTELKHIAETLTRHATETNDAIEEMHRVVNARKRRKP